jgi:hypothetical protein
MGNPIYACSMCSVHFTRFWNGERHNLNMHNNRAEIVPFDKYVAGRNSGIYRANSPALYRSYRARRSKQQPVMPDSTSTSTSTSTPAAADMGTPSRPRSLQLRQLQQEQFRQQQQEQTPTPPSTYQQYQPQYQPPDLNREEQEEEEGWRREEKRYALSQSRAQHQQSSLDKIQELKMLVNKYHHSNPDAFVRCATF